MKHKKYSVYLEYHAQPARESLRGEDYDLAGALQGLHSSVRGVQTLLWQKRTNDGDNAIGNIIPIKRLN